MVKQFFTYLICHFFVFLLPLFRFFCFFAHFFLLLQPYQWSLWSWPYDPSKSPLQQLCFLRIDSVCFGSSAWLRWNQRSEKPSHWLRWSERTTEEPPFCFSSSLVALRFFSFGSSASVLHRRQRNKKPSWRTEAPMRRHATERAKSRRKGSRQCTKKQRRMEEKAKKLMQKSKISSCKEVKWGKAAMQLRRS